MNNTVPVGSLMGSELSSMHWPHSLGLLQRMRDVALRHIHAVAHQGGNKVAVTAKIREEASR